MPRRGLATLMLLAVVPRAAQADTETRRKNDALVAEGYNLTQSWSFGATPAARTEQPKPPRTALPSASSRPGGW